MIYKAIDHRGRPITTVIAPDEETAREKIETDLKVPRNQSRMAFYESWVKGGRVVREG